MVPCQTVIYHDCHDVLVQQTVVFAARRIDMRLVCLAFMLSSQSAGCKRFSYKCAEDGDTVKSSRADVSILCDS